VLAGSRRTARNNPAAMAETKQLFVLRHVKSSWDEAGLEDYERPLAPRGRRAVKALAEHFRSEAIAPELILCSSAVRTRETLAGIGLQGETVIEDGLYAASPGQVLERLQRLPDGLGSAMVIGHNPAMQVLVLRLAASGAASELDQSGLLEIQRKFPTGALATLEFEGPWSGLAPGRARLIAYVRPKQLTGR
jgi:phosphohistidine phosphatase